MMCMYTHTYIYNFYLKATYQHGQQGVKERKEENWVGWEEKEAGKETEENIPFPA